MALLLLIVLLLLLFGSTPTWNHSRNWGYAPSGLLGLVLVLVLIFALLGSIPWYGFRRPVHVVNPRPVIIDNRPVVVPASPAG